MTRQTWATAVAALAVGFGIFVVPAASHNGFGIAPIYTEPMGLVVTDGEAPLVLKWTSREAHADQAYRIKVQAGDFPPTPSPPSAMRTGTELTSFPADALSYEVPLDVSGLASGAWRIYAEFDEPPFCVELEAAPALIVVRRDGDPAPHGVMVTEPLADSPIVDTAATIGVRAIAPAAVTVTIEAGEIVKDPDFPAGTLCVEFTWTPLRTVMADVALDPDPDAGPDRWKLDTTWDTSAVPDGAYLFRITSRDAAGNTAVSWARRWINVEHPVVVEPRPDATPEAGPEASAEAGAESDGDGATADPGDDGCQGGPLGGAWILAALALVQALASSRSR